MNRLFILINLLMKIIEYFRNFNFKTFRKKIILRRKKRERERNLKILLPHTQSELLS